MPPETYSLPSYQQKIMDDALAGPLENAPSSSQVKAQATQAMIEQDKPLQEALQGQQGAVSEMDVEKLRAADQQMAAGVNQANQQQMENTAQMQQEVRAGGQTWGNDPNKTIASGPYQLDLAAFTKAYQPVSDGNTLLSPFVGEGINQGQFQATQDVYSLADMQRASRERIIGTQAQALADMYEHQLGMRKLEAEQKAKQEMQKYEMERDYAIRTGGTVLNPVTGATETYQSPEEEARKKQELDSQSGILNRTTSKGKTFLDEVTDGLGSFVDIIRENPGLTRDEILELAQANVNKFGAFGESNQQLYEMGLGIIAEAGLNKESQGNVGATGDVLSQAYSIPGAATILNNAPNKDAQRAIADQLVKAGSVEAYNQAQGTQITPEKQKAIEDVKNIESQLDSLMRMVEEDNLLGVFNRSDRNAFETLRKGLAQVLGGLLEGGKLTNEDYARYLALLPTSRYGSTEAKQKGINELKELLRMKLGVSSEDMGGNQGNDPYAQFRQNLQPGEILYIDEATGAVEAYVPGEPVPAGRKRV